MGAGASLFLSTPSARRATETVDLTITWCFISIHALREEGDFRASLGWAHLADFYPRPPRGGRRVEHIWPESKPKFLSTPSARRATRRSCTGYQGQSISIHALREEGDFSQYSFPLDIHDFYPRPPRGGRPKDPDRVRAPWEISIHALREEGDGQSKARCTAWRNFYPRPPRGGRPAEARLLFDYF